MEEFLNDKAPKEMLVRMVDISIVIAFFSAIITAPTTIITVVENGADHERYQMVMNSIGNKAEKMLPIAEKLYLSKKDVYDLMFIVNESMPFIVEMDGILRENGIVADVEQEGKTVPEFLRELLSL